MGMDAYAIDAEGRQLPQRGEPFKRELIDATQQRTFDNAARKLAASCEYIDAEFRTGGLGISANASAVNYLLWACGAVADSRRGYPAHDVKRAAKLIADGSSLVRTVPEYVTSDTIAMSHAKAFIGACAELDLGIDISP